MTRVPNRIHAEDHNRIMREYEITATERTILVAILRATLRRLDPDMRVNITENASMSSISRPTLYLWSDRLLALVLMLIRHMDAGRPVKNAELHSDEAFITARVRSIIRKQRL